MEQKDNIVVQFKEEDQFSSDPESFYISSDVDEEVVAFVELSMSDLEKIRMVQNHIRAMEECGISVNNVAISGHYRLAEGASCENGARVSFALWLVFSSHVVLELHSKHTGDIIEWTLDIPQCARDRARARKVMWMGFWDAFLPWRRLRIPRELKESLDK